MSRTVLIHSGIKGQKWGIRRFQNEDGTLTEAGKQRYNKMAKKDAHEYARAKMFYGEGAGNRRKLIKATVEERSKNKYYKEAFDKYLSNEDMEKNAKAAKAERKVRDVKNTTTKTARGVKNILMGAAVPVSLGSVAVVAGYRFIKNHPEVLSNLISKVKRV